MILRSFATAVGVRPHRALWWRHRGESCCSRLPSSCGAFHSHRRQRCSRVAGTASATRSWPHASSSTETASSSRFHVSCVRWRKALRSSPKCGFSNETCSKRALCDVYHHLVCPHVAGHTLQLATGRTRSRTTRYPIGVVVPPFIDYCSDLQFTSVIYARNRKNGTR